jgi:hypothetical protein
MDTTIHHVCNTCVRPTNAPWRHLDATGSIDEGCVDAAHDGLRPGADLHWHLRRQAVRIRARMAVDARPAYQPSFEQARIAQAMADR